MNKRCEITLRELNKATSPITATKFAEMLSVSRQIIVGDVALLRAAGKEIVATSRGYVMNRDGENSGFGYVGTLACTHTGDELKDELYTITDFGATVIDVTVEHSIYGELSGKLDLSSRYEVDIFINKVEGEENSTPLSALTGGIHLHRIGCKNKEVFERVKKSLLEKGIAIG